jgi:hypothetical protein
VKRVYGLRGRNVHGGRPRNGAVTTVT